MTDSNLFWDLREYLYWQQRGVNMIQPYWKIISWIVNPDHCLGSHNMIYGLRSECTKTKFATVLAGLEKFTSAASCGFYWLPTSSVQWYRNHVFVVFFFLAQADKNINTMNYAERLRNYLLFEVYTHNCLIFAIAQHLCTKLTTLS